MVVGVSCRGLDCRPTLSRPISLPFPRGLVGGAHWDLFRVRKWFFPEDLIFRKEGRAAAASFAAIVALPAVFGTRVLGLSDNETCVLAFNKGRSSEFGLNSLCRRVLVHAVASRTRPRWRHLEGYRHPCDGPTCPLALRPAHLLDQCVIVCPPCLCQCVVES